MFEEKLGFFERLDAALSITIESFGALNKYPVLFLPMLITWVFYALTIIYFKFHFDWTKLSSELSLGLCFLILLSFCIMFSIASLWMLEFIQQIESGKKINIFKAFGETFGKDFIKAFPIMFVWAIIWFIVAILQAMFSWASRGSSYSSEERSYENIAKTLSGYSEFSLMNLTFDLVKSGVRMVVFFIYPAIAWEDETCINAIKKGFNGIKNNFVEFVTGFVGVEFAAAIIFIPVAIMFKSLEGQQVDDSVYMYLIMYLAFATSLYLYLQQMQAGILYMWNMKWVKAVENAVAEGVPIPKLQDVKKPSLLDDIPDLVVKK